MNINTIKSEGSLIPADLLDIIYTGEAKGQKAGDFGLNGKIRLIDEIASCWSDAKAYWEAFQHGLNRVKKEETGATVTREQWILPLLRTLGFDGINFSRSAIDVGGTTYSISHRLGQEEHPLPVHIEGANIELDQRSPTGRPRISPHALVQEYLNRTDPLWGIVTNGRQFRILRDSARLSRPTYLEFDLKEMMEGEHFTDFQLFYRIVHRTRFPKESETANDCLLEEYYQNGIDTGGRVREHLRDGVEEALKIFGNGFLEHPNNSYLRELIQEGKLTPSDYYRQLLRLIYRFLFLMVSEERKLVGPDPKNDKLYKLYTQNYSINRLRGKVEHAVDPKERYWDLWEGVKQTFKLYCDKNAGDIMGVDVLNGDLFGSSAMPELEKSSLYNKDFLHAFAHLSLFKEDKTIRRINYGYLDVEELGSVYESLLDYHPVFKDIENQPMFDLASGTERKTTGSYYTRPELVQELIKSALVPVVEDRLETADTKEDKEKALLSLKLCDPASGSGHFLLAGARRIGTELAKVRSGEDQPTPSEFRRAVRDVIQHCIYGVDINPLAVDLCKVALWLEGHNRGYPLTFLDHRIKCGNSLVGVDTLDRLQEGIPNEAFNAVTGDDKDVAKKIKVLNKAQLKSWDKGQYPLIKDVDESFKEDMRSFAKEVIGIDSIDERKADDIEKKQKEYEKIRTGSKWLKDWTACNIWTSAFFYPLIDENDPAIPTQEKLVEYMAKPGAVHDQLVGKANALSLKLKFFHWSLEFPDVFDNGGFDVVLGNPPWERIKLQEQEFFATRDPEIAKAPNASKRGKLIESLAQTNPLLLKEFEDAKHDAESTSIFVRNGNRFALTAVGDVNTYALFAELFKNLLSNQGRAGIIVPTGIATDDSTKAFFANLNEKKALASLYDFENREALFQGVHRSYKFSLLTISRQSIESTKFAFFLTDPKQLDEEIRNFTLSTDDIALINPITHTAPVFRTNMDVKILMKILNNDVVYLSDNKQTDNAIDIEIGLRVDNSKESQYFIDDGDLNDLSLYKFYEGKMMNQYNHRYAYHNGKDYVETSLTNLADEDYNINPRYLISEETVKQRYPSISNWYIGVRRLTRATDERTVIACILPKCCPAYSVNSFTIDDPKLALFCLGALNSLVLNYIVRQKLGGANLTWSFAKQIPLPRYEYNSVLNEFIFNRVLELSYTSYDLEYFADYCGFHNKPFKWNEDRRALLRAELDAYYTKLYGLNRDELRYILDPEDVYGPDFPGETFRVLKNKDIKQYGEYRTRRLVLEAWDRMFGSEV